MHTKEKAFLKCTGNRNTKTALRKDYADTRDKFDKLLRKAEREYRSAKASDFESISVNNPNEFWEKISRLGPKSDTSISMEIIYDNVNSVRKEADILKKWRTDFFNLYHGGKSEQFDNDHYNRSKVHTILLEQNMNDPLYEPNEFINGNITREETSDIVMHAKKKSACGHDQISYIVLKNPVIIDALHNLFQWIFDTGLFRRSGESRLFVLFLKDYKTDARDPMNYRGVSLLSCISKL
ncbi:unnamed protein product [Mytilus coruscus]|uniref:Reverse transcriptase domain-containing protein n=1 Tax=Mytilus coruscus TaxID=42192 RepID=A0A6J8BVW7_MYTCO|nr:unnamed protein product [Mytilus coruscus]